MLTSIRNAYAANSGQDTTGTGLADCKKVLPVETPQSSQFEQMVAEAMLRQNLIIE